MDYVKGLLPYIKVPGLSDISISNTICGCIACDPFGKINKRTVASGFGKPSQEVTTISSLVDKLKADVHQKRKNAEDVVIGFHQRTTGRNSSNNVEKNFHNKCGREFSFNCEMKHEKFTPCEVKKDLHEKRDSFRQSKACGNTNSTFYRNKNSNNVIMAPPRRKNRTRRLLSESSTDGSLDSAINREIWMNTRNLELNNNMKETFITLTHSQNNNQNNVKHSHSVNNKSGCSSIEVDSDSVDVNKSHFMQLERNEVNNVTINQEDSVVMFSENRVYYKNCETDEYGNYYTNGSDVDEVIVCESIISVQQPTSKLVPDDSTYTRLYSDSLYKDHKQQDDGVSSSSFDADFERIVRLKSDTNLQLRSPFQRFKIKRQTKQEERNTIQDFNGIIPVHHSLNESSALGSNKPFATLTRNSGGGFNWISGKGTRMQNSERIPI